MHFLNGAVAQLAEQLAVYSEKTEVQILLGSTIPQLKRSA
jgi:hypothetical protein